MLTLTSDGLYLWKGALTKACKNPLPLPLTPAAPRPLPLIIPRTPTAVRPDPLKVLMSAVGLRFFSIYTKKNHPSEEWS